MNDRISSSPPGAPSGHPQHPPAFAGPFDTREQVSSLPAVRLTYDLMHGSPPGTVLQLRNGKMLIDALIAGGDLALGAYDQQVITWLSQWEPQLVAVICSWVTRAHAAGKPPAAAGQLADKAIDTIGQAVTAWSAILAARDTIVDALEVAAEYRRLQARAEDGDPVAAARCDLHDHQADEYDALAARLREAQPGGTR